MGRYFIELAYIGTNYAGFQVQQNANTIQGEVEKALLTYFRIPISLTGSSRTDAGVHARQNYFHFDADVFQDAAAMQKSVYHLNAILPSDIVIKTIRAVKDEAHCRFDAISRSYQYSIHSFKDPFVEGQSFFYPFSLNKELLQAAADMILEYSNFKSFAKKKVQVYTHECNLSHSKWIFLPGSFAQYEVTGNRFLRGMVRGLTGTMLQVGSGKLTLPQFKKLIESLDASRTDFSVPGSGLCLMEVKYPF